MGAFRSCHCRRNSSSHNPARQRAALYPARRSGSKSLSRFTTAKHGTAWGSGYCLMSNHIHLVAVPRKADVLARTLKETHGRFASYWNALHHSTGHVWQGRYYSCPLDGPHLWEALRYTELNPVRASLVATAERWDWSSAAAHCGQDSTEAWLPMHLWRGRWSAVTWRAYLDAGVAESQLTAIRRSTYSGRPLGSQEFTRTLEKETKRRLEPQKRGPRSKADRSENQETFSFGA
jgi:putative transposase